MDVRVIFFLLTASSARPVTGEPPDYMGIAAAPFYDLCMFAAIGVLVIIGCIWCFSQPTRVAIFFRLIGIRIAIYILGVCDDGSFHEFYMLLNGCATCQRAVNRDYISMTAVQFELYKKFATTGLFAVIVIFICRCIAKSTYY